MECNTCSGAGFVIKQERRKWGSGKNACYMGNLTTGITHVCDDCEGSGLGIDPARNPNCRQCHGSGVRNAWAPFGEYETEPCQCENPANRNALERELLALEVS